MPSISGADLPNFSTFHGRTTSTQNVPENKNLNHFNLNKNSYESIIYLKKLPFHSKW